MKTKTMGRFKSSVAGLFSLALVFFITFSSVVSAATSPGLGLADPFAILSSTYTNTVGGTTITGDVGYTVPPAVAPTINGNTHVANATYNQAGIDQNTALVALNNQPCTHTFPAGPVDLATDTSHGPIGVYLPGVYCTTASSAASIGAGGITLNGAGTYIFRVDGALTTVPNSVVTLAGGASVCDIWWTPTAATTLGANSTFAGTDIDASGINIGSTVTWVGRALAFGGTVTTDTDTISAPTGCPNTPSTTPGGPGTGTGTGTGTPTTPGLPNAGVGTDSVLWWGQSGNHSWSIDCLLRSQP